MGLGEPLGGAERPRPVAGRRSPTSDGIEQDLVGEILRERRGQKLRVSWVSSRGLGWITDKQGLNYAAASSVVTHSPG
jgi:hypothetical protein